MKKIFLITLFLLLIGIGLIKATTITPTCTYSSTSVADGAIDTDGAFTIQVITSTNLTNATSTLNVKEMVDPEFNGRNTYATEVIDNTHTTNTTTWTISANDWPEGSYRYYPMLVFTNSTDYGGNLTANSIHCVAREVIIDLPGGKYLPPEVIKEAKEKAGVGEGVKLLEDLNIPAEAVVLFIAGLALIFFVPVIKLFGVLAVIAAIIWILVRLFS